MSAKHESGTPILGVMILRYAVEATALQAGMPAIQWHPPSSGSSSLILRACYGKLKPP